jgi:glycosyltransferase involved in cell wall biosynthesis
VPGSDLFALAERLGIVADVEFQGVVERDGLDALFRRATIFVHPSREESFGMTLAEAMSYGLPVVGGRRSGGVPDQLKHGEAGILVDVRDPAAIAEAVSSLLEDERQRKNLGEAARRRILASYSAETVVRSYMDVYKRAARSR